MPSRAPMRLVARQAMDFGGRSGLSALISPPSWRAKTQSSAIRARILRRPLEGIANCTVIQGHARFLSPTAVQVGDEVLEAERFFVDVGGRAILPDFPGRDQVRTLTNTTLLDSIACPSVSSSLAELCRTRVRHGFFRRLARGITVVKGGAPRVARGRGSLGRDPRNPRGEGHRDPADSSASNSNRASADIAVGVKCMSGEPEVLGFACPARGSAAPEHGRSRARGRGREGRRARLCRRRRDS